MRLAPLPVLLLLACKPLGPEEYGAVSVCLDGSVQPAWPLAVQGTIADPEAPPTAHRGCDEEPATSVLIRDADDALWRLGVDTRGEIESPSPAFEPGDEVALYVQSSGGASVLGTRGHLAVDTPLGAALPAAETGGIQVSLGRPHGGWRRDDCGSVRASHIVFATSIDEAAVKVGEQGELLLDEGAPLQVVNAAAWSRGSNSLCLDFDPPFGWYAWR